MAKRTARKKAPSKKVPPTTEAPAKRKAPAKKKAPSGDFDAAACARIQAAVRERLERHQSYNPPSPLQETAREYLGDPRALARHVVKNAKGIADEHFMLLAAATHDCPELVQLAPTLPMKHMDVLVQQAAIHGAARFIDAVVARGVDPSPTVLDGQNDMTALHWAAQAGQEAAIRALLAGGADAAIHDRRGVRPLAMAIARNHADCVAAFLDHGVPLATADTSAGGGLVLAVRNLAGLSVDLLLERGCDPDALDPRSGVTALHVAVALAHEPFVRQLVAAGGKGQVQSTKKLELRGGVIPGKTTAAQAAKKIKELKGLL